VDCDDARHDVHPGAEDPPGDRLDQDCSGIDAEPPDVLVIQLESLPARVLQRTGGRGDDLVAPRLAELAARADARLFTRYETAGVQTAPGFASAMCSILPNFGASLTRAHPNVRLRCLPAVLRERGYETRMVQNGNPDFDRQGVFAERIGFSRVEGMADIARATGDARQASKWGLLDEILFRRLAQILADRRPSDPPLLLLAQSINNHHPYAVDDPRFARFDPEGSIWDKVRNCSGYVDSALGDLVTTLDGLARLPARRPLLVVISGDHGHGTGIHPGNVMPTSGLFAENVHTPLVWWMPNHPDRMRGLDSAGFDDPASSADLMPTVLGLLGVHTLHASMGRDLARVAQDRDRRAISENPLAGGLIRIRRPDHVVVTRAVPPGIWWFDASDLDEQVDRSNDRAEAARRGADEAIGAVMAATDLIRRDRVWNDGLLRQP
jgi:phosphoglycerol transferase MdoB-like AlkP superfamily enzyme